MTPEVFRLAAFSDGDEGGNPAGVVLGESFPSDDEMFRIAADVGYSETAFAVRQDDGKWRTRYFAPEQEVGFCGHATIALGAKLGERHGAATFPLVLNDSEITVEARADGSAALVSPPTSSRELPAAQKAAVLEAFRLTDEELNPEIPARIVHGGVDHVLLAVEDRETLVGMHYAFEAMRDWMRHHSIVTIALLWREDPKLLHARNAFAFGGVYEDPATGAAAAALSGYLRELDQLGFEDGEARLSIHQGDDMGDPSRITTRITPEPGAGIEVSGTVREISD